MISLDMLKTTNRIDQIVVSNYAKNRMFERGICIDDIVSCIATGVIIEQYEHDKPIPSCLVSGKSQTGKMVHCVVSNDGLLTYLVTAYYPNPGKWDSDFLKRKNNNALYRMWCTSSKRLYN